MDEPLVDAVKLFADGLTLVYHEARHVRFLIKGRHIPAAEWQRLVGLPRNRVEAWSKLQPVRQTARGKPTAREAARLFKEQFGPSLKDLERLYENPNWKHASAVGGHAWRRVTEIVSALGDAIDQKDPTSVGTASTYLLQGRHNNGPLRAKILELDRAVGVTTDSWWQNATVGA